MTRLESFQRTVAKALTGLALIQVPLLALIAWALGRDGWSFGLAALAFAVVPAVLQRMHRPITILAAAIAVALVGQTSLLVFAFSGHPWQVEMHFYYFAVLAMLSGFCDWRILVAAAALINDLANDRRLNVEAVTEKEYYDRQTSSGTPMRFLGIMVSIIMAVGSSFAAMNTMYAAVARRTREIGTLRVLGFSKGSILLSFFLESVLLSALGGLIGCLLVLPLNGATTGVANNLTFSETAFNFRITFGVMAAGVIFAMIVGAFGGLFPARNAANKEILAALREI